MKRGGGVGTTEVKEGRTEVYRPRQETSRGLALGGKRGLRGLRGQVGED